MKAPQGVEKVVALATLSPEWRAKVLANPVAAAAEAGIELGETELGLLRSVSPRMLAGMIDGFGKSVPRPAGLAKLAAGAAAALLVSSILGCGDDRPHPPCKGILPSNPPPNPRREEPRPPGISPATPPTQDAPKSAEPPKAPPAAPAPGE